MRGVHSTGVAACAPSEVEIKKLALDPINFLDLTSVKSMITVHAQALIGHNRQATAGAVNNANAHPFQHGTITLVHNGTLTNKLSLERLYTAPKFDTDSELVCWLIDNYELSGVIKALEGAFALVWWDSSDNSINMISNGEREFHIAADSQTLYWGSEKKMLDWCMDRAGVSTEKTEILSPRIGTYSKWTWSLKDGIKVETEDLELAPVKKPTTRAGTKTGSKGTGGSVTTLSTTDAAIMSFAKDNGFYPTKTTPIYAYLNKVNTPYSPALGRVQLECTLAANPFCPVNVHYTPDDIEYVPDDLYGIKLEVKSISKIENSYRIIADADPSTIQVIHESDKAAVAAMDAWVFENTPPFTASEQSADEPEDLVAGYNDTHITFKKFSSVLDRGCAVCGSTFDIDAEAADRTCTFVSDDDVICSGCASCESTMRYYGFDAQTRGNLQ